MAVKVGKYHLSQRRQNTGSFWYYWFNDEAENRIQKACGHGCESKRDAVLFLEDLFRADLLEEKRKEELRKKRFSLFAEKCSLRERPILNAGLRKEKSSSLKLSFNYINLYCLEAYYD